MGYGIFKRKGFLEAAVVTAIVALVLLFVTWQVASRPVTPEAARLQQDVDFLSSELAALQDRMGRLQARNAVLQRETDVLRQANRLLRQQESSRQATLNQQQSELDFFRRLAGTGAAQTGLDVYHVDIIPTASDRVFQFVLTLTQNIRRASIISGRVRIDIEGTVGDRPVTLYWSRISDGDTPEPSFRFKYFQQLEGYLTLPAGFAPTRLKLTLESADSRKAVLRNYEWQELTSGETAPGNG
jgi:hypothetical protein